MTSARLRRVSRIQLERLMDANPQLRLSLFSLAARELAAAQRLLVLLGPQNGARATQLFPLRAATALETGTAQSGEDVKHMPWLTGNGS